MPLLGKLFKKMVGKDKKEKKPIASKAKGIGPSESVISKIGSMKAAKNAAK